jgi:hypothetical protein
MELKLGHLMIYMPHKLHVMWQDLACEVEGVDFHFPDTIIVERCNVKVSEVKPILRPLSEYKNFKDIMSELSIWESQHIDVGLDFMGFVNYRAIDLMIKHHIDVFRLIYSGAAININTIKSKEDGQTANLREEPASEN